MSRPGSAAKTGARYQDLRPDLAAAAGKSTSDPPASAVHADVLEKPDLLLDGLSGLDIGEPVAAHEADTTEIGLDLFDLELFELATQ